MNANGALSPRMPRVDDLDLVASFRTVCLLVRTCTLELDPMSQNYKKPFVEKLSRAARDYLAASDEAAAFVLMNRPRDWGAHSPSGGGARRRPGDARKMVEGHPRSF